MKIIEPLFSGKDKILENLMSDEDCKREILKQAANEMLDSTEVFTRYPHEQIMAIAMTGIKTRNLKDKTEKGFASDEEACIVGNIFCKHIKTKNIFPRVTDYYRDADDFFKSDRAHIELGEKCLVSLSLFDEAVKKRTKTNFYEYVGKREFIKEGFLEIARHFSLWTGMFQEYVKISRENFQSLSDNRYLVKP